MFVKEDDTIETIISKLHESNENEICITPISTLYTNTFVSKLKTLFFELAKLDKKPTILIGLDKVNDFELLGMEKYESLGLSFRIVVDGFTYTFEEFKNINNKLNSYLKQLINENMSPYEKYISIYNFTRKFKEYRIIEQPEIQELSSLINNKNQSCNLNYILENDYMDCRGFSFLLQTLLNKVNIESTEFGFYVNNTDGSRLGGHARTLINIDDDKYNIHGIYISDPTWDSRNDNNSLEYSLLPISSMKMPIYDVCNETLLFSAENEDEFDFNMNELYTKLNSKRFNVKHKILEMINSIDRNKCEQLRSINDENQFYNELRKYVLKRNNNIIENYKFCVER